MRRWCFLAAACLLSACIEHRAQVSAPPECELLIGDGVLSTAAKRKGPLPHEIPAAAWRRDPTGTIHRADLRCATPLAWWQRFPIDLVTDLWPATLTVSAEGVLAPQPIPPRDPQGLEALAAEHGYASRLVHAPREQP
ncbi:MAG: hypothetical protein ACOCYN_03545 [Planctomycetota bacterium]